MNQVVVRSELRHEETVFIPPHFATDAERQPVVERIGEVLRDAITLGGAGHGVVLDVIQVRDGGELVRDLPCHRQVVEVAEVMVVGGCLRAYRGAGKRDEFSVEEVQPDATVERV